MRKINEENERIKRRYLQYLKAAKRKDISTVQKAAEGILRFEASTNYASFKRFRIEQVIKFQERVNTEISKVTGKPLSKSTISSILAANKGFIFWLADQAGYKSRIRHTDADYFNMDAKGSRIAGAVRETPYPSMEMARHAFNFMPEVSDIEQRNKGLISLRIKHVNLDEKSITQNPREVATKSGKSIDTFFAKGFDEAEATLSVWIAHLDEVELYGPDDPLFPATALTVETNNGFKANDFVRRHWKSTEPVRKIVNKSFATANLPAFGPHSFRHMLARHAAKTCTSVAELLATSQNLGHTDILTTLRSYGQISRERQRTLVTGEKDDVFDD